MSRESAGSAPALSIHKKPAVPPLPRHSSPPIPLPAVRKPPPLPYWAAPAKRPACAAPRPYRALLPLHRPNSTRTTSAAATKTKIRQSVSALPESAAIPAMAFPPPDGLCTSLERPSPTQTACRPSSSNLFPAAPAAYQSARGRKESAPTPDS